MDEFSAKNILAKVAERGRREAINEVKVLHYDKLVEENAKLKEEFANQDNRVRLYFTAHETMKRQLGQLKSTLDEIKTITSSVLFNKELEQIKSILAKHEGKQ